MAGGTALLGGITSDFNGDGNDDLLVGAPNANVGGSTIGAAYMFYGPISALIQPPLRRTLYSQVSLVSDQRQLKQPQRCKHWLHCSIRW